MDDSSNSYSDSSYGSDFEDEPAPSPPKSSTTAAPSTLRNPSSSLPSLSSRGGMRTNPGEKVQSISALDDLMSSLDRQLDGKASPEKPEREEESKMAPLSESYGDDEDHWTPTRDPTASNVRPMSDLDDLMQTLDSIEEKSGAKKPASGEPASGDSESSKSAPAPTPAPALAPAPAPAPAPAGQAPAPAPAKAVHSLPKERLYSEVIEDIDAFSSGDDAPLPDVDARSADASAEDVLLSLLLPPQPAVGLITAPSPTGSPVRIPAAAHETASPSRATQRPMSLPSRRDAPALAFSAAPNPPVSSPYAATRKKTAKPKPKPATREPATREPAAREPTARSRTKQPPAPAAKSPPRRPSSSPARSKAVSRSPPPPARAPAALDPELSRAFDSSFASFLSRLASSEREHHLTHTLGLEEARVDRALAEAFREVIGDGQVRDLIREVVCTRLAREEGYE
ncbi:hypothetical protein TeGR_g298 [Tetraparma gracilis]|uniref:Uncharacterized protein n=1 Tax=Tetraparma gracilis TaxID=2962635 RepID=A0ABQ6MH65_9STRA|nr:hypothetical protein TeGR_g298 [Tetraparma gracilis]